MTSPTVDPAKRPGSVHWLIVVPILAIVFIGAFVFKRTVDVETHIAPIMDGAIPDRIGCDIGCDFLNNFHGWQPYLVRVAEVARRDFSCKRVEYVNISEQDSLVESPRFFVLCAGANGEAHRIRLSKSTVDFEYSKLNH
jgi:hypothetical protein